MVRLLGSIVHHRLLIVNGLTVLAVLVVTLFPSTSLRMTLGVPFMLFFPGYAAMAALVPGTSRFSGLERLALSFGISVAVVLLIGLALDFLPWGIKLTPILYSVATFILLASVIAWIRARRLERGQRSDADAHSQQRIDGNVPG